MSDLTYRVDVNTSQGRRNLEQLNRSTASTAGAFAGLGKAIAALGLTAFARNVLRSANAIGELAAATGQSIDMVRGLGNAFIVSGGSAEGAQNAITRLNRSINDAAEGSGNLQFAFNQVGISLKDLQTLSEEDILRRTIQGLAEIPAGAQRTALAMQLLGRQVGAVDFDSVNNSLDQFVDKASAATPATELVTQLFTNLNAIAATLKDEFLASSEPVLEVLVRLTDNVEDVVDAIQTLAKVLGLLTAAFVAARAIGVVTRLLNNWQRAAEGAAKAGGFLTRAFGPLTRSVRRLVDGTVLVTGKIIAKTKAAGQAVTSFTKLSQIMFSFGVVIGNLLKVILRFGGVWASVFSAVALAVDLLVKKFFGFSIVNDFVIPTIQRLWGTLRSFFSNIRNARRELEDLVLGPDIDAPDIQTPEIDVPELSTESLDQTTVAIRGVTDALERQRNMILDVRRAQQQRNAEFQRGLQDQLRFMDMSEKEIEIARAHNQITDRAADAIRTLENRKASLTAQQRDLIPLIDQEIAAIRENIQAQKDLAEESIKAIEARRLEQEELNNTLDITREKMRDDEALLRLQEQIDLVGLYGDELQDNLLALDVERELRQRLNELTLRQIELENQRATLGEQRFQQEMAQIERLRKAAQDFADARLEAEKRLQSEQRESARMDVAGAIGRRLEEMARTVDPAVLAVEQLNSLFGNMGRSIDQFVRTGKFKFSDFARSVIQDIIAIQLRAAATRALSGVIGSLFGGFFADGGRPPRNKVSIVGERGPELFVPDTAGTIIPNHQLGAAQQQPVVNNYITNNISAIDSKSVAQLFAENRKTLLGTVQMAQKELPI